MSTWWAVTEVEEVEVEVEERGPNTCQASKTQNTQTHTYTHTHTQTQTHTHSQTPSRQTSDAAILPRLFLVESLEVFLKHVLIHDAEGRPVVVLLQLAVAGKLGWL